MTTMTTSRAVKSKNIFAIETPEGVIRPLSQVYLQKEANLNGHDYIIGDTKANETLLTEALKIVFPTRNENRLFLIGGLLPRGNGKSDLMTLITDVQKRGLQIYGVLGKHEVYSLKLIFKLQSKIAALMQVPPDQRKTKIKNDSAIKKYLNEDNAWILDLFLNEIVSGLITHIDKDVYFNKKSRIHDIVNYLRQFPYGINVAGSADTGAMRLRYTADAHKVVPTKVDLAYEVFDNIRDRDLHEKACGRTANSAICYFGYHAKNVNVSSEKNTVSLYCANKLAYVYLVNHSKIKGTINTSVKIYEKEIYRIGTVPVCVPEPELVCLADHLALQAEKERRILPLIGACRTLQDVEELMQTKFSPFGKEVVESYLLYFINNNALDRLAGVKIFNLEGYRENLKSSADNAPKCKVSEMGLIPSESRLSLKRATGSLPVMPVTASTSKKVRFEDDVSLSRSPTTKNS